MHESTKTISNTGAEPLRVWLEPWAEEVPIPPGETFRFLGVGEQPGELELEQQNQDMILYSWSSSRLTVYRNDEVVWEDFGLPVPAVPEGMAMSSFVKSVFHPQESPEQSKPKSWWRFW